MAKKGPFDGQDIVLTWSFILIFLNHSQCAQGCSMPNFTIIGVSHSLLSLEMAKIWPFMAKTWSSHCPSNWLLLNHNQISQGWSMSNFIILGVSHSPLFLEMAKIWPLYGQNMVLTWSFKLVLPESYSMCPGMLYAEFHNSGCIP